MAAPLGVSVAILCGVLAGSFALYKRLKTDCGMMQPYILPCAKRAQASCEYDRWGRPEPILLDRSYGLLTKQHLQLRRKILFWSKGVVKQFWQALLTRTVSGSKTFTLHAKIFLKSDSLDYRRLRC